MAEAASVNSQKTYSQLTPSPPRTDLFVEHVTVPAASPGVLPGVYWSSTKSERRQVTWWKCSSITPLSNGVHMTGSQLNVLSRCWTLDIGFENVQAQALSWWFLPIFPVLVQDGAVVTSVENLCLTDLLFSMDHHTWIIIHSFVFNRRACVYQVALDSLLIVSSLSVSLRVKFFSFLSTNDGPNISSRQITMSKSRHSLLEAWDSNVTVWLFSKIKLDNNSRCQYTLGVSNLASLLFFKN